MSYRGIRGAITVAENTKKQILTATQELLERMVSANRVAMEDVISVIFTATVDLDAVYPAKAAREMGWTHIPLLCMQEMAVQGSLPRCIRVLLHCDTELEIEKIHHVYMGKAESLRPDLIQEKEGATHLGKCNAP